MGKTSEKEPASGSLIHILIGREEDDPDVEFKAITPFLARQIIGAADGNKELVRNAIQCCQERLQIRSSKPSWYKRHTQLKRKSPSPKKSHRGKLLRQTLPIPKAQAQASGPGWKTKAVRLKLHSLKLDAAGFRAVTDDEILKRARELFEKDRD